MKCFHGGAWPVLVGLALAAGCGSGEGSQSAAPPSSAASAASATSPAQAPETIAQADVEKLLAAWLEAQNQGDLNAYLAFYAERFEGVRRSGERVARLDRKGWAADRSRMFTKKMVVSAAEPAISASRTMAQVTFTQTWASGAYKDVGPKLLVIVKEKGALHIAREEMLASTLQGVKRLPPLAPEQFAFVIHDGGTRLVLKTSALLSWAEGAPQLLGDKDPYPTRKAVNLAKLPAALAGWAGKKVRLYGPAGRVCEATVGALSLVGRVIPHFGEVARWNGTGDFAGQPLSKQEKASAAWDLAGGGVDNGVVLAGELTSPDGECGKALWAQVASAPEGKVAMAEKADAKLADQVLGELRKLPEYAEIQKTDENKGNWDTRGKTEVVVMRHPGGRQLAYISSNAVEGCAGFQGNLSAVFEVNGSRLQLAGKPMGSPASMPAGVIDADGDGKLEILFKEQLLRGEAGYDQLDMLTIPYLDCGC